METTQIDHQQDILAAMVRAYRKNAGLSNAQLKIRVREDLRQSAAAEVVAAFDGMDAVAINRLGGMAFDLRLV